MGHGLLRSKTETGQAALPGQGYMYPFGVIGVAPRYIPAGAVIELAGIRLSCTSTPTDTWKKHRRGESNSGALIPWPQITHLSVKSHPGIAPGPSLTNIYHGACAPNQLGPDMLGLGLLGLDLLGSLLAPLLAPLHVHYVR